MGLFGPDWSWDEWQKKEEFYGELDKQTDKLINGLKQQQDESDYNRLRSEQIRAMQDYANSLTKNDHRLIRRIPKEIRKLSRANIRTNILTITFNWFKPSIQTNALMLLLKIILFFVFIFCIIFNPFEKSSTGDLYLIINILIWTDLYKVPLNLIQAIYSFISIMKTNCYKELVKDLKNVNFKDIEYLGVGAACVRTIDRNNRRKDYNYSSYDFPNLPYDKFGILLAALMWRFGLIFKYKVNCITFRKDNTVNLYVLGDRGINVGFGCDTKVFSLSEQTISGLELFNHSVYAERIIFPWEKAKKELEKLTSSNNNKKEESKKRKQGKTW